jgi:HNH endonuclease
MAYPSPTVSDHMPSPQDLLESLRPKTKTNVMALLSELGHDTTYWSKTKDGNPVAVPAANPSYCYDWSFGSARQGIVLCVWHDSLEVEGDQLVFVENMRSLDEDLSTLAASHSRNHRDRDRARQQAARARDFDSLIRLAFDRLLPIRLIVNEGDRTDRDKLGEGSSHVHKRALDPEPWYVHAYGDRTGNARLVRSLLPARDAADAVEQGPEKPEFEQPDQRQLRAILIRRGQREFRDRLLSAWKRRCVVTECRIEALLEAAHITPHSVEPNYRTSNGLLLRADIHTLYDLGLLSIDEHMRVHLIPELLYSEYKNWEGKRIERRPDQAQDAPAVEALRMRHAFFLEAVRTRSTEP